MNHFKITNSPKLSLLFSSLFFIFLCLTPSTALAIDCFSTLTGDQTMNVGTTCVLKTYVDGNNPARLVSGVDSGAGVTNSARLTLSSGSMTVSSNETLVVGELIIAGGSTAIASGGVIEIGKPMWMVDADADGYPTDTKIYVQSSAPADGLRLNTMTDIVAIDCDDSDNLLGSGILSTHYQDADGDGYGNPSVSNLQCSAGNGYVANNTDCNDTGTNSANVWISATCYVDSDNDDYGSATSKTCTNNATCGSATWASGGAGTAAAATNLASVNTDCYDSNANAKPGSTYCGTVNRGDGSFDYNCSSTTSTCGNIMNYNSGPTSHGGHDYCDDNGDCSTGNQSYVSGVAASGCGAGGYYCSSTKSVPDTCWWQNNHCVGSSMTVCASAAYGVQGCQ